MNERIFTLMGRLEHPKRKREILRVLSIYIETTSQRERDFFLYLILDFTLYVFLNPNPNLSHSRFFLKKKLNKINYNDVASSREVNKKSKVLVPRLA